MATTKANKRRYRQRAQKQLQVLKRLTEYADDIPAGSSRDGLDELIDGTDDGWEFVRKKAIEVGAENGDWAGYPLPVESAKLCVKPTNSIYANFQGLTLAKPTEGDKPLDGYTWVNSWVQKKNGLRVVIVRDPEGKTTWGFLPSGTVTRRFKFVLDTLAASQAWSVPAEFAALARLKTLVTPVAFRYYLLTGTFLETSPRSKIIYMFRKCRPTVAIGPTFDDDTRVLTTLCLHPIGYYEETYAGSMVPTDDVIAHLLLMRGDEHKYWAHANQHSPDSAEAGL